MVGVLLLWRLHFSLTIPLILSAVQLVLFYSTSDAGAEAGDFLRNSIDETFSSLSTALIIYQASSIQEAMYHY